MATFIKTVSGRSLTQPRAPERQYGGNPLQYYAGLGLALTARMLLAAFFVVSVLIAVWVSQLTDPDRVAVLASRVGRVDAWESWVFPAAVASIGLAKIGIAVILWGIARRLWVRVAAVRESLPVLIEHGKGS